jgi:hypothetical protein
MDILFLIYFLAPTYSSLFYWTIFIGYLLFESVDTALIFNLIFFFWSTDVGAVAPITYSLEYGPDPSVIGSPEYGADSFNLNPLFILKINLPVDLWLEPLL